MGYYPASFQVSYRLTSVNTKADFGHAPHLFFVEQMLLMKRVDRKSVTG